MIWDFINFEELEGKVFTEINVQKGDFDKDDEIRFTCNNGEKYRMYHMQDCCEDVHIEEIIGNIDNLLNAEILLAEEVVSEKEIDWGTCTWTFYKLSTIKGDVTIRWYGESNGYYSEGVDIEKIE